MVSDGSPAFGSWEAESIRFTVFPQARLDPFATDTVMWDALGGPPLQTMNRQPAEGLATFAGAADGVQLTMLVRPDRIDWEFRAEPPNLPVWATPPPPTLPDPTLALEQSKDIINAWFHSKFASEASRLAFGAVLISRVDGLREGFDELKGHIQIDGYSEGVADFMYQVNRRRSSTVLPFITMNRLARWVVREFYTLSVTVGPPGGAQVETPSAGFASVLELDMNTAADPQAPIDSVICVELFEELATLGTEIAAKGDIP